MAGPKTLSDHRVFFPMTQRQESFRINHLEAGEKKKQQLWPHRHTHLPPPRPPLQACFGTAQAKGRVSGSNFPRMQGTIEPRMAFIVKMLPSSSLCSSTPDKGDTHAETSLVLLRLPAVRSWGAGWWGGGVGRAMLTPRGGPHSSSSPCAGRGWLNPALSHPYSALAQPQPCPGTWAALGRGEGMGQLWHGANERVGKHRSMLLVWHRCFCTQTGRWARKPATSLRSSACLFWDWAPLLTQGLQPPYGHGRPFPVLRANTSRQRDCSLQEEWVLVLRMDPRGFRGEQGDVGILSTISPTAQPNGGWAPLGLGAWDWGVEPQPWSTAKRTPNRAKSRHNPFSSLSLIPFPSPLTEGGTPFSHQPGVPRLWASPRAPSGRRRMGSEPSDVPYPGLKLTHGYEKRNWLL